MTRLAVLADIHGNLPALEAVEADFDAIGVDGVMVAGDCVVWAPFDRQVMERVLDRRWTVVRGNHELYVADYGTERMPPAWADREQYSILHWALPEILPFRDDIASWPDSLNLDYPGTPPMRMVHGHLQPILPEGDPGPIECQEPVLLCGHTHLAIDRRIRGVRVLNPGSVGVPLDGDQRAGYMLLESRDGDWHAAHRRVPYDVSRVFAEFERRRFREEGGAMAELVIREFEIAGFVVSRFNTWRKSTRPDAPIDCALVAEFQSSNPAR